LMFNDIDETCTPGDRSIEWWGVGREASSAEIIQRALYSGFLTVHGLKVLAVVFPNGIIAYLYGPVSARENDISLLNLSWLNKCLVALQPEITVARAKGDNILYVSLYGYKIFPYLQSITHAHEPPLWGELLTRQRLRFWPWTASGHLWNGLMVPLQFYFK
jgi:hypothetical protein